MKLLAVLNIRNPFLNWDCLLFHLKDWNALLFQMPFDVLPGGGWITLTCEGLISTQLLEDLDVGLCKLKHSNVIQLPTPCTDHNLLVSANRGDTFFYPLPPPSSLSLLILGKIMTSTTWTLLCIVLIKVSLFSWEWVVALYFSYTEEQRVGMKRVTIGRTTQGCPHMSALEWLPGSLCFSKRSKASPSYWPECSVMAKEEWLKGSTLVVSSEWTN